MFTKIEEKIKKLEKYRDSKFPILSVYLGTEGKKSPNIKILITQFHSLINKNLSEKEKTFFKKDIEKIEAFIRDAFNSRGDRTIVFFVSGKNLWKVLDFEFFLPPILILSNSPYVSSIVNKLPEYKKYMVLLIDRKRARLFTVHLGRIEEHEDVFGVYVPQKVKQINEAWARGDKILRHIEDHLHWHLQKIAKLTTDFAKDKKISFLIIGGHKVLFTKMKNHLPKDLAKKVKGNFVCELNIPLNNVFLKSKNVASSLK
ncbi:hypothetical protein C4559_02510 [Candidatus Microgenomates bacterium]|nr:MAG: hypothetical protein C4559_02510 [Candidatus Microgenomates bacterium]